MGDFYLPQFRSVTVRRDGGKVLLVKDGVTLLEMPWEAALELAKVIRLQGARAEQTAKVERVIDDQAFLIRAGIPLALTPNPAVFKEAGNEAAHNRDLRLSMPGGIRAGVSFGMARLIGRPARVRGRIGARGIPTGEKMGAIGGR